MQHQMSALMTNDTAMAARCVNAIAVHLNSSISKHLCYRESESTLNLKNWGFYNLEHKITSCVLLVCLHKPHMINQSGLQFYTTAGSQDLFIYGRHVVLQ